MSDTPERTNAPDDLQQFSDTKTEDAGPIHTRFAAMKQLAMVDADRRRVAVALSVAVFGATVVVGAFGPVSTQRFLAQGTTPDAMFVELVKAIISLVVVVLSINQLALSPELGSVGKQRDRLTDTLDLRRRVSELAGHEVSTAPATFVRTLVAAIDDRASALSEATVDGDPALAERTESYARSVSADVTEAESALSGARFGEFEVIPPLIRFDVSRKTNRLRALRTQYAASIDDDIDEAFDEMEEVLELFTTTRAYLKTIYIRTEYIDFSRALLAVGLPSLLWTYYASQIYDPGILPGATFGIENRLWFVAATSAVALAPFALLVSYVSRLAVLSQSTLLIGPFVAGGENEESRDT